MTATFFLMRPYSRDLFEGKGPSCPLASFPTVSSRVQGVLHHVWYAYNFYFRCLKYRQYVDSTLSNTFLFILATVYLRINQAFSTSRIYSYLYLVLIFPRNNNMAAVIDPMQPHSRDLFGGKGPSYPLASFPNVCSRGPGVLLHAR